MATTFKNALSPSIGTTNTIVYTAANNIKVTVIGISLTNITPFNITASIIITDPGPSGTFTGTFTSGSPIITNVSTFSELQNGAAITASSCVPVNSTISSYNATLGTVTMNNNANANGTAVTVTFVDTQPISSYYVYNAVIPPNTSFRAINGGERLVLGNSNTISVVSSVANSVDAIVGLVEII
jgi:hypothetical protein